MCLCWDMTFILLDHVGFSGPVISVPFYGPGHKNDLTNIQWNQVLNAHSLNASERGPYKALEGLRNQQNYLRMALNHIQFWPGGTWADLRRPLPRYQVTLGTSTGDRLSLIWDANHLYESPCLQRNTCFNKYHPLFLICMQSVTAANLNDQVPVVAALATTRLWIRRR